MNHFDPRAFLRAGSIGVFGFLPLGEAVRLRAQSPAPGRGRADPKDISVIHLVLHGGMSQLDTFDPKPDAQPKFRSIFKPIATNVPGLEICEPLPRTAKLADKYVVIRSMTHKAAVHGAALTLMLTGHDALPTVQNPTVGSVVAKELGQRNELTAYVSIPSGGRRLHARRFHPTEVQPVRRRGSEHIQVRRARSGSAHGRRLSADGRPPFAAVAGRFQDTKLGHHRHFRNTRFLLQERLRSDAVVESENGVRHRAGAGEAARQIRPNHHRSGPLLARRLVEAGVRFVTVGRGGNASDHHTNIFPNLSNEFLPELDKATRRCSKTCPSAACWQRRW
jgi:hypothetical protein